MINVRAATINDIANIIPLCEQLHSNSSYANKGLNLDKTRSFIAMLITSESDNAFVAVEDHKIIGFFFCGLTYEWFSDDLIAFDYSVYVIPERRNGRAAIKLFKAFEAWAKDKGTVYVQIGITTNINVINNSRFYNYLGYQDSGVLFEKRL